MSAPLDPDAWCVLAVRRLARAVAVPALLCMAGGWLAQALTPGAALTLPGPPALSLFAAPAGGTAWLTPRGAMSVGLLLLAALPAMSLAVVLIGRWRTGRRVDVALAAAVLLVLALSVVVKR